MNCWQKKDLRDSPRFNLNGTHNCPGSFLGFKRALGSVVPQALTFWQTTHKKASMKKILFFVSWKYKLTKEGSVFGTIRSHHYHHLLTSAEPIFLFVMWSLVSIDVKRNACKKVQKVPPLFPLEISQLLVKISNNTNLLDTKAEILPITIQWYKF